MVVVRKPQNSWVQEREGGEGCNREGDELVRPHNAFGMLRGQALQWEAQHVQEIKSCLLCSGKEMDPDKGTGIEEGEGEEAKTVQVGRDVSNKLSVFGYRPSGESNTRGHHVTTSQRAPHCRSHACD